MSGAHSHGLEIQRFHGFFMTPADLELRPKKFHDLVSMGFPRDFHGSLEFGIETRKNANGFSMILFNLELKNVKTP